MTDVWLLVVGLGNNCYMINLLHDIYVEFQNICAIFKDL